MSNTNFSTDNTLTSVFDVWRGIPLTTTLVTNTLFTGLVVRGMATPLLLASNFKSGLNATRLISTTLIESSVFGGSVINLNYANTPIPILGSPIGNQTFTIYYRGQILILLNAPEFGDTESLQHIHVQEYSRGNTLISFAVASWGNQKIFDYSFTWMSLDQKDALLNIMRSLLGRKLTIIDHLGLTRNGFIITPETEVFEPVPHGFTANLKFQQVD